LPKAAVLTQYGNPDVLEWRDVRILEPGPGQVRVRVRASGVGPTDLKIRPGKVRLAGPPNVILGFEAAGIVDGRAVRLWVERGDKVASLAPAIGSYGQ
jgi:NADPH:quinone reductase-like Zn-dependent oxidoreductase